MWSLPLENKNNNQKTLPWSWSPIQKEINNKPGHYYDHRENIPSSDPLSSSWLLLPANNTADQQTLEVFIFPLSEEHQEHQQKHFGTHRNGTVFVYVAPKRSETCTPGNCRIWAIHNNQGSLFCSCLSIVCRPNPRHEEEAQAAAANINNDDAWFNCHNPSIYLFFSPIIMVLSPPPWITSSLVYIVAVVCTGDRLAT